MIFGYSIFLDTRYSQHHFLLHINRKTIIIHIRELTMKKTFKLENLDCANCASIMENKIRKINGVSSATISFMTQKLVIEADESRFDAIVKEAGVICKRVEPDCVIVD